MKEQHKMLEFEKWWKKDSTQGDWDYEIYAEWGWEAALIWVHSKMVGFSDPRQLCKDIEEELGIKND